MAHQQKRSTSTEDFGEGEGGAAASAPHCSREPVVVCKFYLKVHRFYARVQSPTCTTYGKA